MWCVYISLSIAIGDLMVLAAFLEGLGDEREREREERERSLPE